MKISVCLLVTFALILCTVKATEEESPIDDVKLDNSEESEDVRTKRSGDLLSSLTSKKLSLLGSLSGGKSFAVPDPHYGEQQHLSYHSKPSFDLWGIKKAIMSSVFQAAKAITGGVLALKGQLIKANGHMVVAKGKLLQTKGEAITNFGKSVATHAFDSGEYHHQYIPQQVHVPTQYGAVGYGPSAFAGHRPNYPSAYGGQSDYSGEDINAFANQGFSSKRAVHAVPAPVVGSSNFIRNAFDKDGVHAGLLILKPIKMPLNNQYVQSQPNFQQNFGYQAHTNGHQVQNNLYRNNAYQIPTTSFGGQTTANNYLTNGIQSQNHLYQPQTNSETVQNLAYSLQGISNHANSQIASHQNVGLSAQAIPQPQVNYGDQYNSASDYQENVAEPNYTNLFENAYKKDQQKINPEKLVSNYFNPTKPSSNYQLSEEDGLKVKSNEDFVIKEIASPSEEKIVPLKYSNDSSPEDQAKLKQTVQRFFNMLQKRQS
ncbi:uncharacterized protein LOC126902793 [Daktulosphaira vitifoliae]|uniref:uncharacterized protein LOC126902793 n=1 Tax=Daktulosphaira vitifoliae TaxID=58002 RepID=UPI0021A9AF5F|nr:uncharacterized protein LOC126902793 [Daktulosphaira vitifoliae]